MSKSDVVAAAVLAAASCSPVSPVNFSRFKHAWLTRGLRECVFGQGYSTATRVDVPAAWSDGSCSPGFPIRCLTPPAEGNRRTRPIRIGLISGRHPALDETVQFYLLRNRELDVPGETFAEQEALAFRSASAFLQDFTRTQGGVVEMYQSGLEPAVFGFYRAVTATLLAGGRGRLWVEPRIFVKASHPMGARNALPRQIAAAVERHPEHLALVPTLNEGELELRWLPERPMLEEEHDGLVDVFGPFAGIARSLFDRSQYQRLDWWG